MSSIRWSNSLILVTVIITSSCKKDIVTWTKDSNSYQTIDAFGALFLDSSESIPFDCQYKSIDTAYLFSTRWEYHLDTTDSSLIYTGQFNHNLPYQLLSRDFILVYNHQTPTLILRSQYAKNFKIIDLTLINESIDERKFISNVRLGPSRTEYFIKYEDEIEFGGESRRAFYLSIDSTNNSMFIYKQHLHLAENIGPFEIEFLKQNLLAPDSLEYCNCLRKP